jgi:antitoxin component YwqK of YwqJK toxin-antitoxin module
MRKLSALALLVACAACGPSQKGPAHPNSSTGDGDVVAYDRNRCGGPKQRVVRLTTHSDGKPDIWKFYSQTVEAGTTLDVLACKQVDLNHDGKVDYVTYYDTEGRVAKEEIDRAFSGTFDETVYYEAGKIARAEYDRNHDGKIDVWAYYENEKLARIERDTKFRGRVDSWEYYEGGKLDRIGWDTTGTGRVDRWERAIDEPEEEGGAASPRRAPPAPQAPGAKK